MTGTPEPLPLLPLEEAQARLLDPVQPLEAEERPLRLAHGAALAAPLVAGRTHPPFDASAMDGYAIRHADLPGPWRLIGEAGAGRGFRRSLGSGETVRIFTGAPMPVGADTVLIQEEVVATGTEVRLARTGPLPRAGGHIRRAGYDFREGETLHGPGTPVTAALVGLAAAAGRARLRVHRSPRVAIVATGDELVPPGVLPGPDQIVSSNNAMVAALLAGSGATVLDRGIVGDDALALEALFGELGRTVDLVVTLGGASVGAHDLVRPALAAAGGVLDFWRIAIRPGKPLLSGSIGQARLLGLPGNPVAAYVCSLLFLLPLVRRLAGLPDSRPAPVPAAVEHGLEQNGARQDFLRATVRRTTGGLTVAAAPTQDSAMLSVLARSNALLVRPPFAPACPAGSLVPVLLLDPALLDMARAVS